MPLSEVVAKPILPPTYQPHHTQAGAGATGGLIGMSAASAVLNDAAKRRAQTETAPHKMRFMAMPLFYCATEEPHACATCVSQL
jgi:hypothetical protein